MDHYKEYPWQGSHGVVTGADRVVTPRGGGGYGGGGGGGVLLLVCARQRVWFQVLAVLVSISTIFGLE